MRIFFPNLTGPSFAIVEMVRYSSPYNSQTIAMPTFITSIKLMAASDSDLVKLNEVLKKKSFLPKDASEDKSQSRKNAMVYVGTTKGNLLEATTDVSTAVSSIGKKFSFTIIKDRTGTAS
jgi:hypothetical protein